MKLLFLTSAYPSHESGTAANVIVATLLETAAELGHEVSWITVRAGISRDRTLEDTLSAKGIRGLGDWTDQTEVLRDLPRPWGTLRTLRHAFLPRTRDDYPRFRDLKRVASQIDDIKADGIVLFWDTLFEQVLPLLKNHAVVYYGARPDYAASLSRIQAKRDGSVRDRFRRLAMRRMLGHRKKRHFSALRDNSALVNICAIDSQMYRNNGFDCDYVSNTWPDKFGDGWKRKRQSAERARPWIGILGNISGVTQTGNMFGMRYLASDVLPHMDKALEGIDWRIRITGGGTLPDDLARAFDHARIDVTGFVPDLDAEMLANQIFLLLNNAGPYTGGYTRVIYAMSSGSCLIAHSRLAESMPEVVHGHNALLGESAEEITGLVKEASRHEDLRRTIACNGRETYLTRYHPEVVMQKLLDKVRLA